MHWFVSMCIHECSVTDLSDYDLVGVAFLACDLLKRPESLSLLAAENFKDLSQVYTRIILYLIASESNHSLPYKSLVKLRFTIEP